MGYDAYSHEHMQAAKDQAQAAEDRVAAYKERTERQGATAHADRQARARTDGLRLATDLVNGQEGTHSVEDVLSLADRFAAYILGHPTMDTPPPRFPGANTNGRS